MTCTDYIYQNHNSDFTIVERFFLKGEEQRVDAFNWRIEYFTNRLSRYVVEHKNGVFTNCIRNDDTSVLVVFDAPKFGTGHLERIIHVEYPNPLYPDGIENVEIPSRTNIEITAKASAGSGRVESQVVLDYMRGENGHSPYFDKDTQTWWEFNDEIRRYEDTGIGVAGGVTRFEFESNIRRIDSTNAEQDFMLSELGAEIVEVGRVAESTATELVSEIGRIDLKDTELSALSQAVAQIQVDINGVEMIQDENLSIIG